MKLLNLQWINFVIMLFLIPFIFYSQNKKNSYYNEALKLIENGKDYENANILLDKAMLKDSTNRDYLLLKSRILFLKSDCLESLKYLEKVILIDKKVSDSTVIYYSELADCLEEHETAIEVLKNFLNKHKSDIVKVKLAQKYFLIERYNESIILYKEYVNDNPKDIDAIIDYIRILFSFKDPKDAIVELKKGLKDNPNNVRLLVYLASCYHNTKQYDEAISIENMILKLDYKAEHIASRAMLYELQGKWAEAYEDYKKIVGLDKCNIDYYVKILQYEYNNRSYDKVIENSYKVINCNKSYESSILDGLYTSLFFCHDFEKGKIYLEKKLTVAPDTFNPYYLKLLILFKDKQYDDILRFIDLTSKTKDINSTNLNNINLLKFSYYLVKEDYEGFINYWKSGEVKSLDNNLNFTFVEGTMSDKTKVETNFNKETGVINTTLIIPTKVFRLLMDKYNFKMEINTKK